MLQGHYDPTDDDPKWIPIGGLGLPMHSYDTSPRAPESTPNQTKWAIRVEHPFYVREGNGNPTLTLTHLTFAQESFSNV